MILAIDIGNTTVTLGGVRTAPQQAYSLEFTARIDINHTWSASQYESAIEQLFEDKNLSPSDFRGVIISSVVPSVLTLLQECVRNLFGTEPLLVTSESDLGMTFSIPEPEKVGRDRLVDAAWAAAHYPLPVITVDLGTATTFNVIRENSVFCGGAIAPGLDMGLGALSERTAQLPELGGPLGEGAKSQNASLAETPKNAFSPAPSSAWPRCSTEWSSASKPNSAPPPPSSSPAARHASSNRSFYILISMTRTFC